MAHSLIPHGLQTNPALIAWLDVNTNFKLNGKGLLLPDIAAINNSLRNLLACPIGARGPIFQPTYGTLLYNMLQEPIDKISADRIRATLIQSIERWEPRIQLDYNNTGVTPDYNLPGFYVKVSYIYRLTLERHAVTFTVHQ